MNALLAKLVDPFNRVMILSIISTNVLIPNEDVKEKLMASVEN
jgi:hypothetical protein